MDLFWKYTKFGEDHSGFYKLAYDVDGCQDDVPGLCSCGEKN